MLPEGTGEHRGPRVAANRKDSQPELLSIHPSQKGLGLVRERRLVWSHAAGERLDALAGAQLGEEDGSHVSTSCASEKPMDPPGNKEPATPLPWAAAGGLPRSVFDDPDAARAPGAPQAKCFP
jgi:hypothetical protein